MITTCCIYVLPKMLLFTIITDLHALDDPCAHDIDKKIVVDMCTDQHAVEDDKDGYDKIDSVVVRVMQQRANCTCRVSLKNIQGSYTVHMRKWSALSSSAPELQNCGLAIDVDYLKPAETKQKSYPIKCTSGTDNRVINLQKNEVIELKSRIIVGSFTRGYCMQIYRNHQASSPRLQLNIQCDDLEQTTLMQTTYESATTKYENKQISTEEMVSTTVTKENHETSTETTKGFNKEEKDQNTNMYIYIGAGAGGVLMIIVVLLIILCIRKRSQKRTKTEKQTAHDSNEPDSDNGELKDNILYVSADQQDVVQDGNYNTVDLEKKPVVNIGVSDTQTQHISTYNSNNEYAVVDKGRKSESVKHPSTLEIRKSSEQDMEMSVVDKTYAVVDKTNRRKADE